MQNDLECGAANTNKHASACVQGRRQKNFQGAMERTRPRNCVNKPPCIYLVVC